MTVIAWDGVTLAADKKACVNGYSVPVTKIRRIGDYLVGWSGTQCYAGQYLKWLEDGRDVDRYPPQKDGGETYLLVVHRSGTVERFESTGYPVVVEQKYFATGSGRDFALAAMHLGCDARRAVEVTCALSEDCGHGIDALTFDAPPIEGSELVNEQIGYPQQ